MDPLLIISTLVPIVFLLIALGAFKWPAHIASPLVLLSSALIAFFVFQMNIVDLLAAAAEGGAIALWPIMLVIVAAIFTYNLAVASGSLNVIKEMLTAISSDRRIQVLILAWGFGGFLESVAGYGTAVAIPASILAALGFNPLFAAVLSLIANTVPTAFGAVGIPVSTLAQITGLRVETLSLAVGIQLSPFIILIPFALVMMTGLTVADRKKPGQTRQSHGFAALKGVWGITFASGLAFAVPQLLAAAFLGAELPALLGSISSLIVTILLSRRRQKQAPATVTESPVELANKISFKTGFLAWLPYLLICTLILVSSPLISGLHHAMASVQSSFVFVGGEQGKAVSFKWLNTPGVLIIIAAIAASLIQKQKIGNTVRIFFQTCWKLRHSAITVVSILAMAKIMGYSGMIATLAQFLVLVAGPVYPLIAGLIGTLGTFVTGSDTSSNILFGKLQTEVAGRIGADPYWLAAANTAGATAGKMISPQSIAVATSSTGLTGQEGAILRQTLLFCLAYVFVLGIMVYLLSPVMIF